VKKCVKVCSAMECSAVARGENATGEARGCHARVGWGDPTAAGAGGSRECTRRTGGEERVWCSQVRVEFNDCDTGGDLGIRVLLHASVHGGPWQAPQDLALRIR